MGNGAANIVAALIIASAIVGSNMLDGGRKSDGPPATEDEFDAWFARAVGDIRNDIVVNCGCCGEGEANGTPGAKRIPTRSF
ncbi:MAG: hypothetical protein AAFW83_07505 [Pseudomonadota bacterium]